MKKNNESTKNEIEKLKKEIQDINKKIKINKNKKTNDGNIELEIIKKQKIDQLNKNQEDIKKIQKKEMKMNDIKNAYNKNNSFDFYKSRKQDSAEAIKTAKDKKIQREKSKEIYFNYIKNEELYDQIDPNNLPRHLFLHSKILDIYGLCPYIKYNLDLTEYGNDNLTNKISMDRIEWLNSQNDKGETYYKLYNDLYMKTQLISLKEEINNVEDQINELIYDNLTESQYKLYQKSKEIIIEYTKSTIRSKILKEKYKTLIHNLSILYAETKLQIYLFLSIKYNIQLVINTLDGKDENDENDNEEEEVCHQIYNDMLKDEKINIEGFSLNLTFKNHIDNYSKLTNELVKNEKFIDNTIKNLKNEMYMYLTDQKEFQIKTQESIVIQPGKYFKRWAVLSKNERNERFESYAIYYVNKNCKFDNDIALNDAIVSLTTLLQNSYLNKKLIYRDFIWNTNKGLIEKIKILKYGKGKEIETETKNNIFYLDKKYKNHNEDKGNILQQQKNSSIRTIFSKENEKIINECILSLILQKKDKDYCVENIKDKLKVKKISKDDKDRICKKYDEISIIVLNN